MAGTVMDDVLSEKFYQGNEVLFQNGQWQREIVGLGLDFQGKTVLDLAAGTGHWEEVFLTLGAEKVFWQDLSEYFYQEVRKRLAGDGRVEYILSDMTAIPLESESVDFVMCRDSLYHSLDEERTLAEVYRVLKKEGYLYLTTRNWRRILREPLTWKTPLKLLSPYLYELTGRKWIPTVFHRREAILFRLQRCGFKIDRKMNPEDSILSFLVYK